MQKKYSLGTQAGWWKLWVGDIHFREETTISWNLIHTSTKKSIPSCWSQQPQTKNSEEHKQRQAYLVKEPAKGQKDGVVVKMFRTIRTSYTDRKSQFEKKSHVCPLEKIKGLSIRGNDYHKWIIPNLSSSSGRNMRTKWSIDWAHFTLICFIQNQTQQKYISAKTLDLYVQFPWNNQTDRQRTLWAGLQKHIQFLRIAEEQVCPEFWTEDTACCCKALAVIIDPERFVVVTGSESKCKLSWYQNYQENGMFRRPFSE